MKKIFLVAFVFVVGVFANSVHAQSAQGNFCDFSSNGQNYTCYIQDADSTRPQDCPLVGGSLEGGFTCSKVPSGYTLSGFGVNVSANPAQGAAGTVNPTITWQAPSAASDPTTCSGTGITDSGPASGSVTVGVINAQGSQKYTVTCKNSGGTVSGFALVNVSAAPASSSSNNTQQTDTSKCQGKDGKLGYCLLEPLPGLSNAPDLNFAQFLGAAFKLLIIAGALLAVATLVYAGITYIISGSGVETGEAKNRMRAAVFGLIILLGAWLMLNTINPALLKFNISNIGTLNTTGGGAPTQTQTGSNTSGTPTNTQVSDCTSDGKHTMQIQSDGTFRCVLNQ